MRLLVLAAFLSFGWLTPAESAAQSLGDVAKKEKKRREENKEKNTKVRSFSETEIFGEPEVDDAEDTDGDVSESGDSEESSTSPNSGEVANPRSSQSNTDGLDEEAAQRRRQEAEWRARFAEARANLQQAKKVRSDLDELYLANGEQYVDADGRVVIRDLEHLKQLIRDADQAVASAQQRLDALDEQARREGVPPGWRR